MKKLFLVLVMGMAIVSCHKKNDDVTTEQKNYNVQLVSKKVLGGSLGDNFTAAVAAADGGQLLVGYTLSNKTGDIGSNHGSSDVWLVKLNSNGDTVWTRSMGGAGRDEAFCAVATSDGGFVIPAYSTSSNSGDVVGTNHGSTDIWVIRLKSNGDTLWTRMLGSTLFESANSIAATPDGGFVIAGYRYISSSNYDAYIVKINSNGNVVWEKTFGGSDYEEATGVSVTSSGEILVTATSESNNSGDVGANHGMSDYWVIKLTANGDKVWSKLYGGDQDDYPASILSTADGGCIVTGTTYSNNNGDVGQLKGKSDVWVLKLNASGDKQWSKLYGGSGEDDTEGGAAICATSDGFAIAGGSGSSDGDLTANLGSLDYWVLKISSSGDTLWSKSYGGSQKDFANALLLNADGSLTIAGYTVSNSSGDVGTGHGEDDGWVIKVKD